MRERLFRFKQFSVSHSAAAMKVGTDGVTLGAWATVTPGDSVLDVGAGCGLIGLMAAQRGASHVTLLEIDPAAAEEAALNADRSPWADRVLTVCADFLTYAPAAHFDRVVCNPPFFTNGALAPEQTRAMARHESQLTLEMLARHTRTLLNPGGTLAIIIPADRRPEAIFAAGMAGMNCRRSALLHTKPGAPPRRILMEFSTEPGLEESRPLPIGSDEYTELTSPFYL